MKLHILEKLLLTAVLLSGTGCRTSDNRPYEPDTPAPPAHTGVFTSDYGTLVFNGDGSSVIFAFNEELAELSGLPSGEHDGTYVFLSGDLPPHGSTEVRYDAAHELEITYEDTRAVLDLAIASEDGSTAASGINTVTEDRIPLLFKRNGQFFSIIFLKEE